jgi:hypothetical protein
MDTEIVYECWDAELKNQSKQRLEALELAIAQTGAVIIDQHENKYFTGKLKWRNPLLLKVKLPKGKRWEFILATKSTIWLAHPPRIQIGIADTIPQCSNQKVEPVKLRGNHDDAKIRRTYRVHPLDAAYIKDYRPGLNSGYEIFKGTDIVAAVLNGDLDLIL